MNTSWIIVVLFVVIIFFLPSFILKTNQSETFFKRLENPKDLKEIHENSFNKIQVFYKHSTRCGICIRTLQILKSEWNDNLENKIDVYYVDVLQNKFLSDLIANDYGVIHQSPQIIAIYKGKVIHYASHHKVSFKNW